MTDETIETFRRFGMQVDLTSAAGRAFLNGAGIPPDKWEEFSRDTAALDRALAARSNECFSVNDLPDALLMAGAIGVDRLLDYNQKRRYVVRLNDGSGKLCEVDSTRAWRYPELMAALYDQVANAHPLPFDEIGGAE